MKKHPSVLTMSLLAIAFFFSSFVAPKPKLLPEIEKFYTGLSASPNPAHVTALNDVTAFITQGTASDKKIRMVFACPDNSFKSIAAEIILQSILSTDKTNKLSTASFGSTAAVLDPKLIDVLRKHGFVVSEANANGQKAWDVKFGENMPSITVFSKDASALSLPQKDFFLMKLCSPSENCSEIPGSVYKSSLSFDKATSSMSAEEADRLFTEIAADLVYAYNKSKI